MKALPCYKTEGKELLGGLAVGIFSCLIVFWLFFFLCYKFAAENG